MITNKRIESLYKKILPICQSDGFIIEINGKRYMKTEVTYDWVVDNAGNIGYIEDTNKPDSRVYASLFVMILICLCLDRRYIDDKGVQFVPVHDSVLNLINKVLTWDLNSGYNAALTDTKAIIDRLRKDSDSVPHP